MLHKATAFVLIFVLWLACGGLVLEGNDKPAAPVSVQNPNLDILFTGRLLGYFRIPNAQSGTPDPQKFPCPRVIEPQNISDHAKPLLESVWSYDYGSKLFVGTGDNFALHMPSRVFEPPPDQPANRNQYSKDQFDWNWTTQKWVSPTPPSISSILQGLRNGLAIVPTDNVGCFLSYAGYDAIVPGKEDFFFGANRVRALARFLASIPPSAAPQYRPVQMLAANLLVKTSWISGHDPIPDSKKPKLAFKVSDLSETQHITFPSDGAEILPWLAEIKGVFDKEITRPEVVISASGDHPDQPDWTLTIDASRSNVKIDFKQDVPCWAIRSVPQYQVSPQCTDIEILETSRDETNKAIQKFRLRLGRLKELPSGNYKVCIWGPKQQPNGRLDYGALPTCSRFTVGLPFLQYTDPVQMTSDGKAEFNRQRLDLDQKKDPKQDLNPSPYLVKQVCTPSVRAHCPEDERTVAVFGVVDPNLEQKIGKLLSDWRAVENNGKNAKKYETGLELADPAKSLYQLIDYLDICSSFGSSSDDCYGAANKVISTKVLLAEMDAGSAGLLAAHLSNKYHFDVVISQYDQQRFTRNQITVVDPTISSTEGDAGKELKCEKTLCDVPSFIGVPPRAWDNTWNSDPVRVLTVSANPDNGQMQYVVTGTAARRAAHGPYEQPVTTTATTALSSAASRRTLKSKDRLSPPALAELESTLSPVYETEISSHGAPPLDEASAANILAKASLYAMLRNSRADVALVQKHDFYLPVPWVDCLLTQLSASGQSKSPCAVPPITSVSDPLVWQKILDGIVWKGDVLSVIPVRGSVLQAIMKDSRQFNLRDESSLSLISETDRGLITLGIQADGFKDSYWVNGAPLDPNRLYSVATTDYIALGDTGYPELIDSSVPRFPRPLWQKTPLASISSLVCNELKPLKFLPDGENIQCSSPFNGSEYFDELYVHDPKPPLGNTWREAWKEWFLFGPPLGQDEEGRKTGRKVPVDANRKPDEHGQFWVYPDLESWAQEQPLWRFSLDKTSIGFAIQRHSESQADLNKNFGGVSNPQATAPRSHSWNTDQQLSYKYAHHSFDFVAIESLLYTASFADAKSGAYRNPNQSADSFTISLGPRFHVPEKRRLPYFGIGTYLHYDTQPFALEQSLSLTQNQVDVATPLQFFLPRVHTLTGRLGVGRYDQKSYMEIGLEGGEAFGAFDRFDIYTNGTLVLSCVPSATLSLQKCVSKFGDTIVTPTSSVRTIQSNRARSGLYWHSLLSFPVGKKMSASFENQGEFYFNQAGDNSTDTRVQNLATAKYSFQVWPSLSFSPTYQIFAYENKQAYKALWQQQGMLTIDFKFDWTSRRIGASQLEYKPAQAQ